MNVFDLKQIETGSKKAEVFFEAQEFTSRLIKLNKEEKIPPCEMEAYVIFVVISGEVSVKADEESNILKEGQSLISEPAVMSMKAVRQARILGIQIKTGG